MIRAVIGANYGDEGKGLAVNYFTKSGTNLVVRHNGGAQSGHTVDLEDGRKFVFHELSSGSFNGATTYWADTYHPDLYVFSKEYNDFYDLTGLTPAVCAHKDTKITIIDDVLLNCLKETQSKNGSCGMGIWECVCRNNAGFGITVADIKNWTIEQIYNKLIYIRQNYTVKRLKHITDKFGSNDYENMLNDTTILRNYAIEIKHNANHIIIADYTIFDNYDNVIFECGQGLLIDGDYDMEHGTPSKTGLYNVNNILKKAEKTLDEAVYVTRTYLTRHGRGNFVEETFIDDIDQTNVFNEWQEDLRYGKFGDIETLKHRIALDCPQINPSVFVTHANKTNNKILTDLEDVNIDTLGFNKIYVSENKFSASKI